MYIYYDYELRFRRDDNGEAVFLSECYRDMIVAFTETESMWFGLNEVEVEVVCT